MLISNTHVSSYVITVSACAPKGVADAANVLRDVILYTTGSQLAIITDDVPPSDYEIVIGKTSRDTEKVIAARAEIVYDGFATVVDGTRLYITSNLPRGTVYGAYAFMEDYLGARFCSDTYTAFVENGVRDVKSGLLSVDNPGFLARDIHWYHVLSPRWEGNFGVNFTAAVRSNHWNIANLEGVRYAGSFVHTILPLAEMPVVVDVQPCLSDEKVYETVLKNVRKRLDENPEASIVSVSQNDSHPNVLGCQCARCREIDEREGTPMGSLLTFVNRIADDIKDDYPNVYVDTLAYQYTRKAPKYLRPRDNVIIRLCSIECCFSHPLDDESCPYNAEFVKDLKDWSAICDNLYVWDYTTDFSCYLAPFPNLAVLRENVRLFKEHHVIGVFEQGNYQSRSGEFAELRAYLLGKLLWDVDMSEERYYALMDEFLHLYYGEGWRYIRKYIDLTSKKAAERHLFIYDKTDYIFPFNKKDPLQKTPEEITFCEELLALWRKAYDAANTDEQRLHVAQSSVQAIYYAEYILPNECFEALNVEMIDIMRATGIIYHHESSETAKIENIGAYPDLRRYKKKSSAQ